MPAKLRAAFAHDVEMFDAGFFGIPPIEARAMDPHQRLLLQAGYQALHHAGLVTGLTPHHPVPAHAPSQACISAMSNSTHTHAHTLLQGCIAPR